MFLLLFYYSTHFLTFNIKLKIVQKTCIFNNLDEIFKTIKIKKKKTLFMLILFLLLEV